MNDSNMWTVDQLAATNLLAELKLEPTEAVLNAATRHLASHRRDAIGWAAERAHGAMIRKLEAAAMDHVSRQSDEWAAGYHFAEQQILTTMPEELLELGPDKARSKGQVLRAMVRHARRV